MGVVILILVISLLGKFKIRQKKLLRGLSLLITLIIPFIVLIVNYPNTEPNYVPLIFVGNTFIPSVILILFALFFTRDSSWKEQKILRKQEREAQEKAKEDARNKAAEEARLKTEMQARAEEEARMRKLEEIFQVSTRLSVARIAQVLEMDVDLVWKKVFDWAKRFKFTIEGEDLIITKESVDAFVAALDKEFQSWGKGAKV